MHSRLTITAAIIDVVKDVSNQMIGGQQIDAGILRAAVTEKLPDLDMCAYGEALTMLRSMGVLVPCGGTQLWMAINQAA